MVDIFLADRLVYKISKLTTKNILVVDLKEEDFNQNHNIVDWCINTEVDVELVVFDYTYRYTRNFDEFALLTSLNDLNLNYNWMIVTSDFNFYKSAIPNIIYYPIHAINMLEKDIVEVDIIAKRPHILSFLSYHLHSHRLISLLKLYQRDWFNNCLLNFQTIESMSEHQQLMLDNAIGFLTEYEKEVLQRLCDELPFVADESDNLDRLQSISNRGFSECCINMFTEADYDMPFLTEKSIKPFLSGQFTAVLGNGQLYAHLRELGFDLFSEYINIDITPRKPINCMYDTLRYRLETLLNQITKLIPMIDKVWDTTYNRRKHNYDLARSPELLNQLTQPLNDYLADYNKY